MLETSVHINYHIVLNLANQVLDGWPTNFVRVVAIFLYYFTLEILLNNVSLSASKRAIVFWLIKILERGNLAVNSLSKAWCE
jgi:hypothetical protein